MQKIFSAGTSVLAAAMTCSRRARPPTSCSTFGRLLLSRVPLPAAMIATAKPVASMPAIFSRRAVVLRPRRFRYLDGHERAAYFFGAPGGGGMVISRSVTLPSVDSAGLISDLFPDRKSVV